MWYNSKNKRNWIPHFVRDDISLQFRITALIFIAIISFETGYSQGSAGMRAEFESRYIVDLPTAGVLRKGTFSGLALLEKNGSIMIELSAAPFRNFNIGLSYSGGGIISSAEPTWQNLPGFHLRWRFMDETLKYPAITIGAISQGRGVYLDKPKRFETYSPGIFTSASKNYIWALGSVAFHAGFNFSFEPPAKERMPNFYLGLEHSIGNRIALNAEYNTNLDEKGTTYIKQKGLLNAALRWTVHNGFTLEMQFRDLLKNRVGANSFSRALCLEYIEFF